MPQLNDSTLRLRILVADSNSPDAERLRAGIDALFPGPDSGVEQRVASTLQEAEHELNDFQPNIIFIDPLCEPIVDWLEFIRSVRKKRPGIVFVLYTEQEALHLSTNRVLGYKGGRILQYYLFPKETPEASFASNIQFNLLRCRVDLHHSGAADSLARASQAANSLARACAEEMRAFTPEQIVKLKEMQQELEDVLLRVEARTVSRTAFVAMPSDSSLERDYKFGVRDLLEEKGFEVIRAVDHFHLEEKTTQIRRDIKKATVVIANLTLARPNCYYELGYAKALGKICIPVAKQGTELPFMVRTQDCIFYESGLDLRQNLATRLSQLGF